MKRNTRPPLWLRALGLKMTGYLRGCFTDQQSLITTGFAIRFAEECVTAAMASGSFRRCQNFKQLLDWKPHHIFETPIDTSNDQITVLLDAVSARLVEGIDL